MMTPNRLLIGIIAAIVVLLIVGEILSGSKILFVNHFMIWIPFVVWIYFVWMVWKKGTSLFHDQMEQKLVERRLKWLKIFMLLGGISWALLWVTILYGTAITDEFGTEESLAYIPFSLTLLSCAAGTTGFLVIYIRYIIRRRITKNKWSVKPRGHKERK